MIYSFIKPVVFGYRPSSPTEQGKNKMRKVYVQKKDKEALNDFQLGQVDILKWLETTFLKEKSELETKRSTEIFSLSAEEFLNNKLRYETINMYLWNVRNTIKQIIKTKYEDQDE